MKHRVRITRRALADADETHAWMSENVSRAFADRWYAGLLDEIEKVADHPLLHPKAMESDDHPVPLREAFYGGRKSKHRILYTVQDDEVVVLYIHHSSRGKLEP